MAILVSTLIHQPAFAGSVTLSTTEKQASIENGLIKVTVDTGTGTYRAVDQRDQRVCTSNASSGLNDYVSTFHQPPAWTISHISSITARVDRGRTRALDSAIS